jgi:hypothetical protein
MASPFLFAHLMGLHVIPRGRRPVATVAFGLVSRPICRGQQVFAGFAWLIGGVAEAGDTEPPFSDEKAQIPNGRSDALDSDSCGPETSLP